MIDFGVDTIDEDFSLDDWDIKFTNSALDMMSLVDPDLYTTDIEDAFRELFNTNDNFYYYLASKEADGGSLELEDLEVIIRYKINYDKKVITISSVKAAPMYE